VQTVDVRRRTNFDDQQAELGIKQQLAQLIELGLVEIA
jgi:hypothetical protein